MEDFGVWKQVITAIVSVVTTYFLLRERLIKLEHRVNSLESGQTGIGKTLERLAASITHFDKTLERMKSYFKYKQDEEIE